MALLSRVEIGTWVGENKHLFEDAAVDKALRISTLQSGILSNIPIGWTVDVSDIDDGQRRVRFQVDSQTGPNANIGNFEVGS